MDIQCAECGTPYRVPADRIPAAGARIGCKKCGKKFKVRKGLNGLPISTPDDFAQRDFLEVGLQFSVKGDDRSRRKFTYFGQFEEMIAQGQVRLTDQVSWDGMQWHPIGRMGDREGWFWDKWKRGMSGEITSFPVGGEGDDPDDMRTEVFVFRPTEDG